MYKYDSYDQQLVDERVAQYRDQTQRFLAGQIPDEEFRALRLRNGLYVQRFAPMLRISIPYGLLASRQLRMLGHIARTYDKGFGHFTTRQNLQFHWPKLEQVPDILAELASVQMHAIQTSGNCIRNVTSDHLAGVARDELVDPRPYCEIARQWATFHPEFNWLPRKFKLAFSATTSDRAASRTHDIGIHIIRNEQGELGYTMYVGGGLGRMPMLGHKIRDFLPELDLLSYLEAILRIYNRLGRRDNIHRARIKVLVKETGPAQFAEMVEAEWEQIRHGELRLQPGDIDTIKSHFDQHVYDPDAVNDHHYELHLATDPAFASFVKRNVLPHREDGYRIVFASLKPIGGVTGDISAEQLDVMADLAERYSYGEARVTHDQNIVLGDVRKEHVYTVWQTLAAHGLATPNIGLLTDLICCPGLDYCSLANAGSISVSQDIADRFESLDYLYDIGEIKIKMSGCMNGCGHHSVGHIGILGVDKHGEEWYQVTLGGSAGSDASLGDRTGPAISRADIAGVVERIISVYMEQRRSEDETFLQCYRRIGMSPFKARIYATDEVAA